MKHLWLSLSLLFLQLTALQAQRALEVYVNEDSHGAYVFYCTNHAQCNYVLQVNVTNMFNVNADHSLPYLGEVKPGSNLLFRLTKGHSPDSINFNYTIGFHKGCLHPRPDTAFTYLLPVSPGKEVQVYEITNGPVTGSAGASTAASPSRTYGIRLRMKPGDTIFAARRGIVTEVNTGSSRNDAGTNSTEGWNYVEIVQADCSFARYGILKKDGAFVHPGQLVQAGMPIGIVGGDQYGRGSDIRLNVSYDAGPDTDPSTGKTGDIYWVDLPLKFWTKRNGAGMLKHGGTYISEFPPALLKKEQPPAGKKTTGGKKTH